MLSFSQPPIHIIRPRHVEGVEGVAQRSHRGVPEAD